MVFEIPAGPTAGGLLDFWERPFADLGQTGPDKGQGAKYLMLGPGHEDMNPKGYIVVRSQRCRIAGPQRSYRVRVVQDRFFDRWGKSQL